MRRPAAGGGTPRRAGEARADGRAGGYDQLLRVLTDRELEVLAMVARGLSNAEIAEQLTISPATAKTHVAHLLTKLDARDRIQLVIMAYQCGLVPAAGRQPTPDGPFASRVGRAVVGCAVVRRAVGPGDQWAKWPR